MTCASDGGSDSDNDNDGDRGSVSGWQRRPECDARGRQLPDPGAHFVNMLALHGTAAEHHRTQ